MVWDIEASQAAYSSRLSGPVIIDLDHARLWDVANGEIVRCTSKEVASWAGVLTANGMATN